MAGIRKVTDGLRSAGRKMILGLRGHRRAALALLLAVTLLAGIGGGVLITEWLVPLVEREQRYAALDTMEIPEKVGSKLFQGFLEEGKRYATPEGIKEGGDWRVLTADLPDPNLAASRNALQACVLGGSAEMPMDGGGTGADVEKARNFISAVRSSVVTVEVEYLQIQEITRIGAGYNAERIDSWILANCRILRRIAWREGEISESDLQIGQCYKIMLPGSARMDYGATPQIQEGDRAILMLQDIHRMSNQYYSKDFWRQSHLQHMTPYRYYAMHTPYFYIPVGKNGERLPDYTGLNEHLDWMEWAVDQNMKNYGSGEYGRYMVAETCGLAAHMYFPEDPAILDTIFRSLNRRMGVQAGYGDFARWMDEWYALLPLFPTFRCDEFSSEEITDYAKQWGSMRREENIEENEEG